MRSKEHVMLISLDQFHLFTFIYSIPSTVWEHYRLVYSSRDGDVSGCAYHSVQSICSQSGVEASLSADIQGNHLSNSPSLLPPFFSFIVLS